MCQSVRVIAGEYLGRVGELISLYEVAPEPIFHLETSDGDDAHVRQSEIEPLDGIPDAMPGMRQRKHRWFRVIAILFGLSAIIEGAIMLFYNGGPVGWGAVGLGALSILITSVLWRSEVHSQ
jgi:hypothetical protein